MPVTVKLSEQFYRKFGHEAVDEMVNWFNQVDDTYRGQLRELNELNFARFDAKVEQRMSQLEANLAQRVTQLESNLTQLEARLEQRLAQFDAKLERRLGGLESKLTRWMFAFWVGNVATTAGLVFTLAHFLRP
jgi:phage shock protein A